MSRMQSPPLRYVLAILRFPPNLNVEKFMPAFQENIWEDYPQLSEETVQSVQLQIGSDGSTTNRVVNKIWQFLSSDRDFAILLGQDFLVLHAGKGYAGHEDFIARFHKVVAALTSTKLIAKNMTALGLRYVDLVAPIDSSGETLSDYLEPWVMPSNNFNSLDNINFINSASAMAFSTPQGILRFQTFRRPPMTLPMELNTPLVNKNGWVEKVPDGDFAVLDFDHGVTLHDNPTITPDHVADLLLQLRTPVVSLFESSITPHARQVWN